MKCEEYGPAEIRTPDFERKLFTSFFTRSLMESIGLPISVLPPAGLKPTSSGTPPD
jgi:hypothetical protein